MTMKKAEDLTVTLKDREQVLIRALRCYRIEIGRRLNNAYHEQLLRRSANPEELQNLDVYLSQMLGVNKEGNDKPIDDLALESERAASIYAQLTKNQNGEYVPDIAQFDVSSISLPPFKKTS